MVDHDVAGVALAGLLHDVGKPMQRGKLNFMGKQTTKMEQELCRFHQQGGYFSHRHVLWTFDFFERFPFLNFKASGSDVQNMAAFHHAPSDQDAMCQLIQEADRLSAAGDRKKLGAVRDDADNFRTARLIPIFEEIRLEQPFDGDQLKHRYPLVPLSPEEAACFPQADRSIPVPQAIDEYRKLCDAFFDEVSRLEQSQLYGESGDRSFRADLLVETMAGLVQRFMWSVPSSTMETQDISLFDHGTTTAALASALYVYHRDTNSLSGEQIRDTKKEKFLLVGGDLSGIQRFIFDLTVDAAKGAARMLRARSFLLTILTEWAVAQLLSSCGLTRLSRIMDAGGRFVLLLPNTETSRRAVAEVETRINRHLFAVSNGELSMGLATLAVAPSQLESKHFADTLAMLTAAIDQKKLRPFPEQLKKHPVLESFLHTYDDHLGSCHACGKRPATKQVNGIGRCESCDFFEHLGAMLVKSRLYMLSPERMGVSREVEIPGLKAWIAFPDFTDGDEAAIGSFCRKAQVVCQFAGKAGLLPYRPLANHVPTTRCADEGERMKTFEEIAQAARIPSETGKEPSGVTYLAILKADVDSLGLVFRYGLADSQGMDRMTMSRFSQLSRMLNYFFAAVLPSICEKSSEFNDFYTVYAGGDDLFLVGPWNRIAEFTRELDEQFTKYVGKNPELTISSAVTLFKSRQPINFFASIAEENLKKAKNSRGDRKRVVGMFGDFAPAEDVERLISYGRFLDRMLKGKKLSLSFIYKLLTIMDMEKKFREEGVVTMGKYRSMFHYLVERTVSGKRGVTQDELKRIHEFLDPALLAHARIPITYAVYSNREQ